MTNKKSSVIGRFLSPLDCLNLGVSIQHINHHFFSATIYIRGHVFLGICFPSACNKQI